MRDMWKAAQSILVELLEDSRRLGDLAEQFENVEVMTGLDVRLRDLALVFPAHSGMCTISEKLFPEG
jgi:hypothetical protein